MMNTILQIQPQFSKREQWVTLSEKEGLLFEALELFVPPVNGDDALRSACLDWYRGCGRVNALHGAFIDVNPASGDEAFRSLSRRRCEESCRIARELGADKVVFHSSAFPFLRGDYLENWADK